MKILKLRFQNLNSLRGEWIVDFTTPEYTGDGIFAITGPTGAGKSTVLDAICLALYGRTPRLKAINQTANEIMSRQSGECFAEVVFATQSGQFRCHWSQHRARRKPDGKLAPAKHEISDAVNGAVLESNKREVLNSVEQKTGMNFDRFSRSMLLAQGGFDAFLQASASNRAPILEQITGTEIYSDISKRVHERNRAEVEKLSVLQVKLSGLVLLDVEEEVELRRDIAVKQEDVRKKTALQTERETAIQWLQTITKLEKEHADVQKKDEDAISELKAFDPERRRLQKGLQAAELDGDYATLVSLRQTQLQEQKNIEKLEKEYPALEKAVIKTAGISHDTEKQVVEIKEQLKGELELIKEVRRLDVGISEKKEAVQIAKDNVLAIRVERGLKKEKQQEVFERQQADQNRMEDIEKYLEENRADAALVAEYSGLATRFKILQEEFKDIVKKRQQVADIRKDIKADLGQRNKLQKKCKKTEKVVQKKQEKRLQTSQELAELLDGRLLREYRQDYDHLLRERAYLRKIADLEAERNKLEDGRACPLCGALEHPFAEGNIPLVDEIDIQIATLATRIKQVEELEIVVQKLQSQEQKKQSLLGKDKQHLHDFMQIQKNNEVQLQRLEDELQQAVDKRGVSHLETVTRLTPFGVAELSDQELDTVLQQLDTRKKRWLLNQENKKALDRSVAFLAAKMATLTGAIQNSTAGLKKSSMVQELLQKNYDELVQNRCNLYGDKNPDAEEQHFARRLGRAEKREKQAREKKDKARLNYDQCQIQLRAIRATMTTRKAEIFGLESSFLVRCQRLGFKDESVFLAQKLSVDDRQELQDQARALDEQQIRVSAKKKDLQIRLDFETAKKLTTTPLEDLQQEQRDAAALLREMVEDLGKHKQKLAENTRARDKYAKHQVLLEKQQVECNRFSALHALIGSADGKKFRNFAQGLTFELMVAHANTQLAHMTDRYLLVRDDKQPLELNVVDHYQAGEIRSTKNLSGGESFIVSLSLALGLSKMASQKVRVDSLFLDEGFGTLDEEALETALEALAGLQHDSKLIGVISHVVALKDRISTQITVNPRSGGKSVLHGPGCSMVAG